LLKLIEDVAIAGGREGTISGWSVKRLGLSLIFSCKLATLKSQLKKEVFGLEISLIDLF